MKYLPLVWSALARKPVRAFLTLMSVVMAFTLFGLTIGLNATFAEIEKTSRADRVYIYPRFGDPLPMAIGRRIASIQGVSQVGTMAFLPGYHQVRQNNVLVMMVDENMSKAWADWPLSQAQWNSISQNRTGLVISQSMAIRWKLSPGADFVIAAPGVDKADGTKDWRFRVLAVTDDVPAWGEGYMLGNIDYLDKAKPLVEQGQAAMFHVLAADPGRTSEVGNRIVSNFANSATPLQFTTEKVANGASVSGLDIVTVARGVAIVGLFMILFLTANVIAQSVRERFAEFATLKTIGFRDSMILLLVVLEAAAPCAVGSLLGVGLAGAVAKVLPQLFPPGLGIPIPIMTPMVFFWAILSAALVAVGSAALPVMRLKRMDIATALARR